MEEASTVSLVIMRKKRAEVSVGIERSCPRGRCPSRTVLKQVQFRTRLDMCIDDERSLSQVALFQARIVVILPSALWKIMVFLICLVLFPSL